MVQAIASWRSIGKRYTDSEAYAELVVQPLTSVGSGSELGINRVEFAISYNGAPPVIATSTVMEACYPNHSDAFNLIPGAAAGALAPIPGYRIQIPMDPGATPVGTITVTATVFSNAGTATPLDLPIVLWNDADGTDRRPSSKVLYVDQVNGSDAAAGTIGAPLKNLQKALSGEMGGSHIYLVGYQVWGSPPGTFSNWFCTGGHWVTIEWLAGATTERVTLASDGFLYTGTTPGSACRLRMVNSSWLNWGGVVGNNNLVTTEVWLDGGLQRSAAWSPIKNWSLKFFDQSEKVMGFEHKTASAGARMYATNFLWLGVVNGPSEFYSLHDCVVSDFVGVGVSSFEGNAGACNLIVQKQRAYRDLVGRVRGPVVGSDVTVPAAGQMRIDATGPLFFSSEGDGAPMDLSTLAEIVGSSRFHVSCSGFTAGGNNGIFPVLSAGIGGGGLPFVVLANASAVAGSAGGSALMETWNIIANTADLVHPDLIFLAGATADIGGMQINALYYGITARDLDNAQTFFSSDTPLVRVAFWNCRDGNNKPLNANMIGGDKTDCLFFHNTIAGAFQFGGSQTGTQIINNVFGVASGISGAQRVDSNHFITGSTFGDANATTGTWFPAGVDPNTAPWLFTPDAARLGTASVLTPALSEFYWPGTGAATRGVGRDGGLLDWEVVPPAGRGIDVAFSATIPITLQAGVALGLDARFASTIPVTLSASFALSGPLVAAETVLSQVYGPSANTVSHSVPAVPSDTTRLTYPANGFVGSGGAIAVELEDGDSVTFAGLPASASIDLRIRRVNATGTAAATVVALY